MGSSRTWLKSCRLSVEGSLGQISQVLSVFEMLTGQVFLVTLVAGLVKSVASGGARSGEQQGG